MLSIDIISEILTRLPVKTLCRLRLVCKAWRALISDPDFQQSHRRRSKQNPLLLLISQRRIRNKGPRLRRNQYRLLSIKHREEENHMSGVSCFSKWRWVSAELSSCQNQRHGTEQNYGPGYYFLRQWQIVPTCLDLVCIHDTQTVYICNPMSGLSTGKESQQRLREEERTTLEQQEQRGSIGAASEEEREAGPEGSRAGAKGSKRMD